MESCQPIKRLKDKKKKEEVSSVVIASSAFHTTINKVCQKNCQRKSVTMPKISDKTTETTSI
jgi:hypothetical protein